MHATHHHPHRPFAWIESWPVILAALAAEAAVFIGAATGIIQ